MVRTVAGERIASRYMQLVFSCWPLRNATLTLSFWRSDMQQIRYCFAVTTFFFFCSWLNTPSLSLLCLSLCLCRSISLSPLFLCLVFFAYVFLSVCLSASLSLSLFSASVVSLLLPHLRSRLSPVFFNYRSRRFRGRRPAAAREWR